MKCLYCGIVKYDQPDLPQLHPDSSLIIWTNKCIRGAAVAAAPDHNNTEEQVDIEDASMSVVFAVALQVLACVLVLTWKSFTSGEYVPANARVCVH